MSRILITNPEASRGPGGNSATARRWSRHLRDLGHRVTVSGGWIDRPFDVLIALHARRSAPAIQAARRTRPDLPVILLLTGTDLYRDLPGSRTALRSIEQADRLVVLQQLALRELPAAARKKAVVIHQSAVMPRVEVSRNPQRFRVSVLANLRTLKDPLRTAYASRDLPPASRIEVVHLGRILEQPMGARARKESRSNRRYRWLGAQPGWRARRILAGSRLVVVSSLMEGGANVVSEAVVAGVPVLASGIPGNVGLLGKDYPGYFPVKDTGKLTRLLLRAETDRVFYRRLEKHVSGLKSAFSPAREQRELGRLVTSLSTDS